MDKEQELNDYLNLNWSYTVEQDEQLYIIRVSELPGVCTDATTIAEGMKNIREVMKAALELYLEQGDPIPVS